jgi:hypothetical protein
MILIHFRVHHFLSFEHGLRPPQMNSQLAISLKRQARCLSFVVAYNVEDPSKYFDRNSYASSPMPQC